jgi:hypothetical protein
MLRVPTATHHVVVDAGDVSPSVLGQDDLHGRLRFQNSTIFLSDMVFPASRSPSFLSEAALILTAARCDLLEAKQGE